MNASLYIPIHIYMHMNTYNIEYKHKFSGGTKCEKRICYHVSAF